MNIDILGISELNGLEWVNLTQMTIISTTVGKNPLEETEHLIVNKCPKCSTWMPSQKRRNDLCSFQDKPFSITLIQVCAPVSDAEVLKLNGSMKTYKTF